MGEGNTSPFLIKSINREKREKHEREKLAQFVDAKAALRGLFLRSVALRRKIGHGPKEQGAQTAHAVPLQVVMWAVPQHSNMLAVPKSRL